MKITPKMEFVSGSWDMDTCEMVCIPSRKYASVGLALRCGDYTSVQVAEIKLYDSDLWRDAKETFEDAKNFGEEMARRWNAGRKGGAK